MLPAFYCAGSGNLVLTFFRALCRILLVIFQGSLQDSRTVLLHQEKIKKVKREKEKKT